MTTAAALRRAWIVEHLTAVSQGSFGCPVNVIDQDFVVAYIGATGAAHRVLAYGAPRCPTLGRDLAALHQQGLLQRTRTGVHGAESGFPRWVWDYELASATQAS